MYKVVEVEKKQIVLDSDILDEDNFLVEEGYNNLGAEFLEKIAYCKKQSLSSFVEL